MSSTLSCPQLKMNYVITASILRVKSYFVMQMTPQLEKMDTTILEMALEDTPVISFVIFS